MEEYSDKKIIPIYKEGKGYKPHLLYHPTMVGLHCVFHGNPIIYDTLDSYCFYQKHVISFCLDCVSPTIHYRLNRASPL